MFFINYANLNTEARERPRFIILVGLPGSGKTTWRKTKVAQGYKGVVINPDDIRKTVFGVYFDPKKEHDVWEYIYKEVRRALLKGESICFDATNVRKKRRQTLIRLGHEHNAYVEAIYFKVLSEVALRRNVKRMADKRVPLGIMIRMARNLQPPELSEGFDRVKVIDKAMTEQKVENDT
ncbi:MAG TPA: AAA family ATPase [Candidatus Acidoferrales bacterium]|nr:AAA family ATPase [Candidatus Acidoferrales bacterium]